MRQQARRVLDRLVGYQISPLLWRKIRRGLSAGRVQLYVYLLERDQRFCTGRVLGLSAPLLKNRGKKFQAKLLEYRGKKIRPVTKEETDAIIAALEGGAYRVSRVEEKERMKRPLPPFTTSSLQQEASTKLNFNTKKTMMIAQQLYEGVDIKGQGTIGLVTYIRTDSVRISDVAKETAKNMILADYGPEYLGTNVYTNKKKDVQDAHEAIRPSNPELKPDDLKESLSKDQYNLYRLIWCRFTASQMSYAVFDAVSADIENNGYLFRRQVPS